MNIDSRQGKQLKYNNYDNTMIEFTHIKKINVFKSLMHVQIDKY